MHRDLKAEATKPPSRNLAAQQRRFQRWRRTYNELRPHEALSMGVPAEFYRPSSRRLGEHDKIRYPKGYLVFNLSGNGSLRFQGKTYFVGEALGGCRVALHFAGDGVIELHFANLHLGNLAYGKGRGHFVDTYHIARPEDRSHKW